MQINVRRDQGPVTTGYGQNASSQYGQGQMGYGQGFSGQGYSYQAQYGQPGYGHYEGQYGGGTGQRQFGSEHTRHQGRRTRWQREPMTAREVMTTNIRTVTRQSSLREVAQIMKDESVGIVPVVDEGRRLLGVVTDRDLVIRTLAEGRNPLDLKASDIMTDDIEAVTPDEPIHDIIELMASKLIRRVPVVDRDDRLLGIISIGDLATKADYDEDLQDALEKISAKRSFWSRLWT